MMSSAVSSSAQRPAFLRDFTGKERDAETGLDYFEARYYSGALGRWIGADLPFPDQQAMLIALVGPAAFFSESFRECGQVRVHGLHALIRRLHRFDRSYFA